MGENLVDVGSNFFRVDCHLDSLDHFFLSHIVATIESAWDYARQEEVVKGVKMVGMEPPFKESQ